MIEKIVILAAGAVLLALLLSQKYKLLCWVWLCSMVVGPRRAHFAYKDPIHEIDWIFEIIPFTVLLLILTVLTVQYIGRTLNRWDLGSMAILGFGAIVGLVSQVEFDLLVAWFVPIFSVFLTKHLIIVFVRSPRDEVIATRIFMGVCFIIGVSFVLTAAGITLGGLLEPPKAYGVATGGGLMMVTRSEGFWGDATVAGITAISIVLLPGLRAGLPVRAGLAVVQFACVLVSGKRLAILTLGLVSGYLVFGIKNRGQRFAAMALGVLMIGALFVFLPDTGILERFEEARSAIAGEKVNDQRMLRFGWAIDSIGRNPIVGSGVGGVGWIHNGVLEILANLGILGIPVLLSFVVPVIRSYRTEGLTNPWAAATVIYLLSPFMLEAVLNRPENLVFLGFFLGMTEVHQRLRWMEVSRWRSYVNPKALAQ